MTLLIKICGLSTPDTLAATIDAGVDMVGFVFFAPSPRNLSMEQASTLGRQAQGKTLKVALSVDADDAFIDSMIEAARPDLLQLHGHETPDRVRALKARTGLPIIKAIHVSGLGDLAACALYEDADRLIFDARPQKGAALPGGNGAAFDWTVLERVQIKTPWMLSGGLGIHNVEEALAVTRAHGLDVSSGVECAPGVKDVDMIARFVAQSRSAYARLALGSGAGTA
jgi:phosphoribosylanthranilate isomerase